jgi:hypothetical protein
MNFQPFGVFAQALRNTSFRLRGWPLISKIADKDDYRSELGKCGS